MHNSLKQSEGHSVIVQIWEGRRKKSKWNEYEALKSIYITKWHLYFAISCICRHERNKKETGNVILKEGKRSMCMPGDFSSSNVKEEEEEERKVWKWESGREAKGRQVRNVDER